MLHQPVVVKLDMSVDDQCLLSGVDEVMAIYGYVDVVINCAGISHRGTAHETDLRVYRDIMQVNFFGPLALIKGDDCRYLRLFKKSLISNMMLSKQVFCPL